MVESTSKTDLNYVKAHVSLTPSPNTDLNFHVIDFLSYYLNYPKSPDYAVLVNGPWGSGKTHIVTNFLKAHFSNDDKKYIYVSLNGLKTVDEFDEAVFATILPKLGKNLVDPLLTGLKTALSFAGLKGDSIKLSKLYPKPKDKVYVFDDLERCTATIQTSLGYVNRFVEQMHCRVIIIAHDKDIRNQDRFKEIREKVVGKTLNVRSDFASALQSFVDLLEDEDSKTFFLTKSATINEVYQLSNLKNLRLLRQTLLDFERIFKSLTAARKANDAGCTALLRTFFALSLEHKFGNLTESDFADRTGTRWKALYGGPKDEPKRPLIIANEKYTGIDLYDPIFSDQTLINFLCNGLLDTNELAESIDKSTYYVTKINEPAWRTLWNFIERKDDDVVEAISTFKKQFQERAFIEPGEILHAMGLQLLLTEMGEGATNAAEVVVWGKGYVDDLFNQGRLKPYHSGDQNEFWHSGYGGLGFYHSDQSEFKELFSYLESRRLDAGKRAYPEILISLLKEMNDDPDAFVHRIYQSGAGQYGLVPVFSAMKVDEFVQHFLKLEPLIQRHVLSGFKIRYEHARLHRDLAPEQDWVVALHKKIAAIATSKPGPIKRRLERILEHTIGEVISDFQPEPATAPSPAGS